jgi:integrase
MAQTIGRLSALKVAKLTEPGYHADGGNLYFRVAPGPKNLETGKQSGGARGWIFRFALGGRTRDMGLGAYPHINLAAARDLATKFRALVKEGVDPIERRRADRATQRIAAAKNLTFDECAQAYIEDHEAGWRNSKHRRQWSSTLKQYASPAFGKLPVGVIDTDLVMRALKPIWSKKTETASRLRGRVESVLDWARVRGYRTGENPARWRGNLDHLLPPRSKVRPVQHHAALPYLELPKFMADLRGRADNSARALEFTILTAARTSESIGATQAEIDARGKTWTVPGARMKGGKEHRVPLSRRAFSLLDRNRSADANDFIFEGLRPGKPLSNMAMLKLLERMDRADLTVHGFRSTFRDWAAERTNFPNEVVEMALAHVVENKAEAAYRRGDLFDKRRRLMDLWAEYCASGSRVGTVSPITSARVLARADP